MRHLRALVAVAEHGSVTRAAASLHMAQPPLSRTLASLERQVGTRLLVPSTTGTSLTPAGQHLADTAARLLRELAEAVAAAAGTPQASPAVRLGFVDNMGPDLLAEVVRLATTADEPFEVTPSRLTRDEQLRWLVAGRLDLGLVWGPFADPLLSGTVIREEPMVVVLPRDHALAAQDDIALGELAGESWANVSNRHGLNRRDEVVRACRDAGFEPRMLAPVNSLDAALALVGASAGVLAGPRTIRGRLPSQLTARSVRGWTVTLYAVTAPGDVGRNVTRLITGLRNRAAPDPEA